MSGNVPSGSPGTEQQAQRSQGASSSAPSLTPGPANLGKASQATAKDSSVAETAQLARGLQLAKADAQTAKHSEASAQRKLADAEAAVQRAREEARRATAEAEQAQESKEMTKRKLADAEAARVAAEGRERTCENANKERNEPEPTLGERLRSWFG